jgi:hypothetical protein
MAAKAIWRGRLIRTEGLGKLILLGLLWGAIFLWIWAPWNRYRSAFAHQYYHRNYHYVYYNNSSHQSDVIVWGIFLTFIIYFIPNKALNFAPLFLRSSLRDKGYSQMSVADISDLLELFSVDSLARLPPWEELRALPGADCEQEFDSVKRVLANALHDANSLKRVLSQRGYDELSFQDAWALMNLYGNLALLELPAWSVLAQFPGSSARGQVETIKALLRPASRKIQHAFHDAEGRLTQPRPLSVSDVPRAKNI